MNKYKYEGPVMIFDICASDSWKGETMAVSEKKARSNLTYQYKKSNNLVANSRVTLPGKIILSE